MSARAGIRVTFAATCAFFVLGFVASLFGKEPYPALLMPGFAGHPLDGTVLQLTRPDVTVQFADGRTTAVPATQILPAALVVTGSVLDRTFDPRTDINAQAADWLKSRLARLCPGQRPVSVDITWRKATYSIDNRPTRYETIKTVHIDFPTS
jgi:hypothetical protein